MDHIYIFFTSYHEFISFLVYFETNNVKTHNLIYIIIYKCLNLRFDLYDLKLFNFILNVILFYTFTINYKFKHL